MWRELHDLFPEVGSQRSGAAAPALPARTAPLGVGPADAPAAAACAPIAAAAPSCPHQADSPASSSGESASPLTCRAFGCDDLPTGDWTGRCEPHGEAFRDRAHELTTDIGRGRLAC